MNNSYSRSHANRGKLLENLVDMSNRQYLNGRVADIRKVPTPVKILKKEADRIIGHLERASWVDYSGIYNGRSIIFDAKETKVKNFPLKNVHVQQFELLKSWYAHGAIAFLLIAFWLESKNEPEIYVLTYEQLEQAWLQKEAGGAKSIPLAFFRSYCSQVPTGGRAAIDYLAVIDLKQGAV